MTIEGKRRIVSSHYEPWKLLLQCDKNGDKDKKEEMKARSLICFIAIALATGCTRLPARRDIVTEFRTKHEADAAKYDYIYPVGAEVYYLMFRVRYSATTGIANSLKERWGQVEGIEAYANRILSAEAKADEEWQNHIRDLRSLGTLCEFKKVSENKVSWGLLVLNKGNIVKEEVWNSELSDR